MLSNAILLRSERRVSLSYVKNLHSNNMFPIVSNAKTAYYHISFLSSLMSPRSISMFNDPFRFLQKQCNNGTVYMIKRRYANRFASFPVIFCVFRSSTDLTNFRMTFRHPFTHEQFIIFSKYNLFNLHKTVSIIITAL